MHDDESEKSPSSLCTKMSLSSSLSSRKQVLELSQLLFKARNQIMHLKRSPAARYLQGQSHMLLLELCLEGRDISAFISVIKTFCTQILLSFVQNFVYATKIVCMKRAELVLCEARHFFLVGYEIRKKDGF